MQALHSSSSISIGTLALMNYFGHDLVAAYTKCLDIHDAEESLDAFAQSGTGICDDLVAWADSLSDHAGAAAQYWLSSPFRLEE